MKKALIILILLFPICMALAVANPDQSQPSGADGLVALAVLIFCLWLAVRAIKDGVL